MAGLLDQRRTAAADGLLAMPRRVDDKVAGLLGLDPSIQRGALLPLGRDASGEMVFAWPQVAVDSIKSLMLPGHVMQGGEFTPRDVTEMALDVGMLSSVVPAPAGAKRMFGGINAKNAPLDDLAKAEAMEKAGTAADDIWRATGWGRGADGKWRFEIDDSGAALTEAGKRGGDSLYDASKGQMPDIERHKAGGVLEHPELYAAYDDAAGIETRFRRMEPGGSYNHGKSSFAPSGFHESIDISAIGADRKGTALHELQHAVQQREGFAKGGNPVLSAAEDLSQVDPRFVDGLRKWNKVLKEHGFPEDQMFQPEDIRMNDPERLWDWIQDQGGWLESKLGRHAHEFDEAFPRGVLPMAITPDEAYRRLAGEVEARNVQTRMNMDAATRRQTPPWATEDVPRDQQIVRGLLGDGGVQMSASLPMDEASRMARADAGGMNVSGFHGTNADINEFRGMTWISENPDLANQYAAFRGEIKDGANVMPLTARVDNTFDADKLPRTVKVGEFFNNVVEQAIDRGAEFSDEQIDKMKSLLNTIREAAAREESGPHYARHDMWNNSESMFGKDGAAAIREFFDVAGFDSVRMIEDGQQTIGVFDPARIRSRFAAFDPARRDSTDILASYLGVPGIGLLDAMPQDEQSRR